MRRSPRSSPLVVALAAPGRRASPRTARKTTLGDIEDEVMCPICGTPLALASDAPQAQRERAYIERLIAAAAPRTRSSARSWPSSASRVLALPGDAGDDDGLEDVLVYVIPALGDPARAGGIAFARRAGARARPAARRRRRRAAAPDSGRLDADMERYDL